ncbi:hypothetical protein [Dehalococcoides mccartyi]|jgi:hypothetical protein|uniref:hypothetical protein n=1 Tax=Dehalococcoides mccartyi TaxID=61435 RepID=UPI000A5AD590|nr:hypothetical protein [Dehalococcoides mccartyi]
MDSIMVGFISMSIACLLIMIVAQVTLERTKRKLQKEIDRLKQLNGVDNKQR